MLDSATAHSEELLMNGW